MFIGDPEIAAIMEYAEGFFTLPPCGQDSPSVEKARQQAVFDILNRTKYYRQCGLMPEVIHVIFTKKMEMIRKADTVHDLNLIGKTPKPHYNGVKFIDGPFSVPEEELLIWSLTSLRAPLVSAAFDRYMELFEQVFGKSPVAISDENIQAYREKVQRC